MKATVELVFEREKPAKQVEVEIRDGLKGARMLDAIDKAVEAAHGEGTPDGAWVRWNLVNVDG